MLCVLRVSSLAVQGVPPRVVVIQRSECHTALTSLRQRDRLFFTPLLVLSDLSLFLCPFFSLPPSLSLSFFCFSLSLSLFFYLSLSLSLRASFVSRTDRHPAGFWDIFGKQQLVLSDSGPSGLWS